MAHRYPLSCLNKKCVEKSCPDEISDEEDGDKRRYVICKLQMEEEDRQSNLAKNAKPDHNPVTHQVARWGIVAYTKQDDGPDQHIPEYIKNRIAGKFDPLRCEDQGWELQVKHQDEWSCRYVPK
jgi:hypothetical protein